MSCWIKLGIEPTKDQDVIRGAYRARLPEFHPETDPQGFQLLRQAYEHALKLATRTDDEDDEEDEDVGEEQAYAERPPRPPRVHPVIATFARMLADPARRGVDGNRGTWIADPDGNRIEIMEMAPGCIQHEAIATLKRTGSATSLLRPLKG